MNRKEKRIIVFAHVPKTAGTSLKYLLRRYFGLSHMDAKSRKGVPDAIYRPKDLRKDILFYPKLKLIASHGLKPYVSFEEFEARMQWFTFMREPIARYISHYIHQQTSNHEIYKMDMIKWSKRFRRDNCTVRMFAGERNLEKAKEMLHKRFKVIGLTEEFDTSVRLIKNAFGLERFDTKLEKRKMIIRDTSIKDNLMQNYNLYEESILENNQLDLELYKYFIENMWKDQVKLWGDSADEAQVLSSFQHKVNFNSLKLFRNTLYKPYVYLDNLRG